jgi:site-specific DNA-methyltransferase (adenine-specific)
MPDSLNTNVGSLIRVLHGDCLELLPSLSDIDAVVCDPPYHLDSIVKRFGSKNAAPAQHGSDGLYGRISKGFMGQRWDDGGIAFDTNMWRLVLNAMKPGAYLIAFSSTRTYHHMACAIEAAGFITHPMVGWLYGQGFPKATRLKAPGTDQLRYGLQALKPSLEPIYLGQKPMDGTGTENWLKYGTGALDIGACRVPGEDVPEGRWPSNVLHDGSAAIEAAFATFSQRADSTTAARFFPALPFTPEELPFCYAAKASQAERHGSTHPAVKPLALMRWLCRLVTPPGGTVLDPFAGTGATGEAAWLEGFNAILIEREPDYQADITRRLARMPDASAVVVKTPVTRRSAPTPPADPLAEALVVDVETRSLLELPKVGAHRYAAHSSTRMLLACFSFVNANSEPEIWLPDTPLPAAVHAHLMRGGMVAAWNAAFDVAILNRFLPPKIPRITIAQTHDIAAQAASASLPRGLDKCCAAIGLPEGKDGAGQAAMRWFMRPRKWVDGKPVWGEDPARFVILGTYCQRDVWQERTIMRRLPQLQAIDRPVFELDLQLNARGMRIDRRLIDLAGPALYRAMIEANRRIAELTQDAATPVPKVTSTNKIVQLLQDHGVDLILAESRTKTADTAAVEVGITELIQQAHERDGDAEAEGSDDTEDEHEQGAKKSLKGAVSKTSVAAMLERDNLPDLVRQVLELRRDYGRTSTAKLRSLAATLSPADDRTRDYISYHAASTGRAGGRLIQPQNLPRESYTADEWPGVLDDLAGLTTDRFVAKYGISPVAAIVKLIRGAIIPAPGHVLCGGDFAKIELCVGAWLAMQEDLLADLHRGIDAYRVFATTLYGIPLDRVTDEQRQICKSALLGCIFGLGPEAFMKYVLATAKVEIDLDTAERIVRTFRETYDNFPVAWKAVGRAALHAVEQPGSVHSCLGDKVQFRCTPDRRWLTATLPSGRRLRYPKPHIVEELNRFGTMADVLKTFGVSQYTHQWGAEHKHGSLLFQNITQAVARDILTAAALRFEAAGLPVILHVHDELLAEVPMKRGVTHALVHRLMTERPAWTAGLPIDAECWVGIRYGKTTKLTRQQIMELVETDR